MMKKSIFAVAVASALTFGAAQAETVLYGSIRYDYENAKTSHVVRNDYTYDGKAYTSYDFRSKRLSNLEDAGSRIGITGSEDLGNNNAVIYNIEIGFNGMSQSGTGGNHIRKSMLGLTGDWGTFAAGRMDNPFWQTIVEHTVLDDFNGSNVISAATQRAMTSALNGLSLASTKVNAKTGLYDDLEGDMTINTAAHTRVGKVIAYITPEFAGFQASAALMMDKNLYNDLGYRYTSSNFVVGKNQQKTIDLWTINASYNYDLGANGAIIAKAGYINGKLADNNSSKMWGLSLGYYSDAFKVTAAYANGNHTPQNSSWNQTVGYSKDKYNGWDIGASFSFGPNYFSTIRAAYGQNEIKQNSRGNYWAGNYYEGGKDKVKSWAVGFEQKLSTRTRAWVEYGSEETTYNQRNINKKKDDVFSIGMRHDF
ncbi:porin [Ignatzschineria rhizosphaerae]|uniref:Porin n=1 Tax=Ignatzschineria rhizosphaerae TaxID=2923279 RepID=A0ABY3X209_9GAMM|nr:porin [Ignatzschineria rhizosphaerae]UNM96320.1 porin [Ignatzschineria rhizosphaerae]